MEIEIENLVNSFRNLSCNHRYVPSATEQIESKFLCLVNLCVNLCYKRNLIIENKRNLKFEEL